VLIPLAPVSFPDDIHSGLAVPVFLLSASGYKGNFPPGWIIDRRWGHKYTWWTSNRIPYDAHL